MKVWSLLLFPLGASSVSPPTPPVPPTPPADSRQESTGSRSPSNDQSYWKFKSGAGEVQIRTSGSVTLDADSKELFRIDGNGSLEVEERDGSLVRQFTATKDKLSFQENGSEKKFDVERRVWLSKVLKARPATPTPPPVAP